MEGIVNENNAMDYRTVYVSIVPGPEGARAIRFQGNTFKDLKDRLADAKLTRVEAYVEVLVDGDDYICLLDTDNLPAGDLLARIYVGPPGAPGLPMRFKGHGRHGKMHHGPHHGPYHGPHGYGKDGAMHGPGLGECGKHAKKMHKLHAKMHKLHHKMGRHGPPFPHGPGFGRGGHHHGGMRHPHGPPPFGLHSGMMHHGLPGFGMHTPRPTCPGCEDENSAGTSSSSGTTSNDGSAPRSLAFVSEGVQGIVLE